MTGRYFFSVILLIWVATAAAQDDDHCTYTFFTETGHQDGPTSGAVVDLIFDEAFAIFNMSRYNVLGPQHISFQSDADDAFFFCGQCKHYCNVTLLLIGGANSSWNVSTVTLGALFPDGPFRRTYHVNEVLQGIEGVALDFCSPQLVGTEKQKLTGASLLRLFGMPSYTT